MEKIKQLAGAAPDRFNAPGSVDWVGVEQVLHAAGSPAGGIVAATWASLSLRPSPFYESNSQLILVFPHAIIGTNGKSKRFGGGRKYDCIDLSKVERWGPSEDEIDGKYGILCIEFAGERGALLGRLVWHWSRGKRLPDNTDPYVSVGRERDRIADVLRANLPRGS